MQDFNLFGFSFELVARLLVLAFFAILFLQSSLDKIFDSAGNKSYLNSVFANTFLKNTVPLLFPVITLLEFSAGFSCALGAILLYLGQPFVAKLGLVLCAKALVALFFGQRIAKDYAGAASLAAYFALVVLGFLLLR